MEETTYQLLQELVGKADLELAIDHVLALPLERTHRWVAITISRQYHKFNLEKLKGVIPAQDQILFENQIADRLLALIDRIYSRRQYGAKSWLESVAGLWSRVGRPSMLLWGLRDTKGLWRWIVVIGLPLVIGVVLVLSNYWRAFVVEVRSNNRFSSPEFCLGFQGQVVDQAGYPQADLRVRLRSGRSSQVTTDRWGFFNFWEYFPKSRGEDTLEVYRDQTRLINDPIQFPGGGRVVVEIEGEDTVIVPPRLDTCNVAMRLLPFSMEIKGKIFVWQEDALSSDPPLGVEGIHVYVNRRGCVRPGAETWTDGQGDYELHLDSAAPYPDSIVLEDPHQRYLREPERFILKRPSFDYSIRKK